MIIEYLANIIIQCDKCNEVIELLLDVEIDEEGCFSTRWLRSHMIRELVANTWSAWFTGTKLNALCPNCHSRKR